jgi:hypothetical protein
MNTQPFPDRRKVSLRHKWSRVSDIDLHGIRDFVTNRPASNGRRLFAIVRQAEPSAPRRILLFDNHPDTLRLVFEQGADQELAGPSRPSRFAFHLVVGVVLISVLVSAMFWPLLIR